MGNARLLVQLYGTAFLYALVSFAATGGPDGELFVGVGGFAVIGVLYVYLVLSTQRRPSWHLLGHALVFLAATVASFLFRQRLDEMGGMLYFLLPAIVIAFSSGTVVLLLAKRLVGRRSEPAT